MKSWFNDLLTALNILDRSSNSLHFSLQILFAMAEVLRTEFDGIYTALVNYRHFFPLFHYPLHRWLEVHNDIIIIIIYILPVLVAAIAINVNKFFLAEAFMFCEDFTQCGCSVVDQLVLWICISTFSRNSLVRLIFQQSWGWTRFMFCFSAFGSGYSSIHHWWNILWMNILPYQFWHQA